MILKFENYRFAAEILASDTFRAARDEIFDVLSRLPAIRRGQQPWSLKPAKPNAKFPIDQNGMNRWLDAEFHERLQWDFHPLITEGSKLAGDYRKNRIQIEVQFGNMARWTYDILKFQICYSQEMVDIGVLVVPMRWFAKAIGDNIAYFERVWRELPHAKLSITLPILLIGLDASDDEELSARREPLEREARLDEQWEVFLNEWAATRPEPVTIATLAQELRAGDSLLTALLPEDVRPGEGEAEREFRERLSRGLARRRAKRRLEKAGHQGGANLWVVKAPETESEEE